VPSGHLTVVQQSPYHPSSRRHHQQLAQPRPLRPPAVQALPACAVAALIHREKLVSSARPTLRGSPRYATPPL
jgi:hypothetical protein